MKGGKHRRSRGSLSGPAQEQLESNKTANNKTDASAPLSKASSSNRLIYLQAATASNPRSGNYPEWIESLRHDLKKEHPHLSLIFLDEDFNYPELPRPAKNDEYERLIHQNARRPRPPREPQVTGDREADAKADEEYQERLADHEIAESMFETDIKRSGSLGHRWTGPPCKSDELALAIIPAVWKLVVDVELRAFSESRGAEDRDRLFNVTYHLYLHVHIWS